MDCAYSYTCRLVAFRSPLSEIKRLIFSAMSSGQSNFTNKPLPFDKASAACANSVAIILLPQPIALERTPLDIWLGFIFVTAHMSVAKKCAIISLFDRKRSTNTTLRASPSLFTRLSSFFLYLYRTFWSRAGWGAPATM